MSRENVEHLASCRSRGWGSSKLSAARRSSIWLTSKMEGPRGQTAAKTRRIMDRMLFSSISVRSALHLVGSHRREFDMNPRRRKRRKKKQPKCVISENAYYLALLKLNIRVRVLRFCKFCVCCSFNVFARLFA